MPYKNEYSLKELIQQLLEESPQLAEKYASVKVQQLWKQSMGIFSQYTRKIELKGNKLVVYMTNPLVKNELRINKTQAITMVNEKFGKEIINTIEIR